MSFMLCSHGGQEAPCSQRVSVCAEIITAESDPWETKKWQRSAFLTFFLTPALPWHLCLSALLIEGGISKASFILLELNPSTKMSLSPGL